MSAGLQGVEGVLFDYGLTLVHFERPAEALEAAQAAIAARIAAAGHPRPDTRLLAEAVHDRVEAEVAAHEASGALEEIDVAALQRVPSPTSACTSMRACASSAACSCSRPGGMGCGSTGRPGNTTTLRDRGLRLGLCSNAPYHSPSMHGQLAHLGLDALIDAAVFSGEVGWRKPSPRLFQAALAALGARAAATVFIGDRVREDVRGAAGAGMRAVLIVREGSVAQPLPAGEEAVAVIHSLAELPALLFAA